MKRDEAAVGEQKKADLRPHMPGNHPPFAASEKMVTAEEGTTVPRCASGPYKYVEVLEFLTEAELNAPTPWHGEAPSLMKLVG